MIWSTMVDKIKNIAVEIFTQEAEESLLLSQNILLLAVLIAVGVLWCCLLYTSSKRYETKRKWNLRYSSHQCCLCTVRYTKCSKETA